MALQFCSYIKYVQIRRSVLNYLSGYGSVMKCYFYPIDYAAKYMGIKRENTVCCFCGRRLANRIGLRWHLSSKHTYEIERLVETVVDVLSILSSLTYLRGSRAKKWICKVCGLKVKRKSDMVKHILFEHGDIVYEKLISTYMV